MNDRTARITKRTFRLAGVLIVTVALLLLAALLYKQKEYVRGSSLLYVGNVIL